MNRSAFPSMELPHRLRLQIPDPENNPWMKRVFWRYCGRALSLAGFGFALFAVPRAIGA